MNEKVSLGKGANKAATRRRKGEIDEMIADREADDDDDEEMQEWEMAQAQRAGTWEEDQPEPVMRPVPHALASESTATAVHAGRWIDIAVPTPRGIPTIPPVRARLAARLAQLEMTKTESERTIEGTVRELAGLEEQESELRKEVARVEGKREWVEGFRGWVEMLGAFLEEKVGGI